MKIQNLLIVTAIALSFWGCAQKLEPQAQIGYIDISSMPKGDGTVNPVKRKALEEAATSLGARGALAWRAEHINDALTQEAAYLDQVFNFNALLINNNVLPATLVETDKTLN